MALLHFHLDKNVDVCDTCYGLGLLTEEARAALTSGPPAGRLHHYCDICGADIQEIYTRTITRIGDVIKNLIETTMAPLTQETIDRWVETLTPRARFESLSDTVAIIVKTTAALIRRGFNDGEVLCLTNILGIALLDRDVVPNPMHPWDVVGLKPMPTRWFTS